MVEDDICRFTAALEVAKRTHQDKHKNEKPTPNRHFWSDGMVMWPRLMTDEERQEYS